MITFFWRYPDNIATTNYNWSLAVSTNARTWITVPMPMTEFLSVTNNDEPMKIFRMKGTM